MKKIKALKVRPCEHEFVINIHIQAFKSFGEYGVIRSMQALYGTCNKCGYTIDAMVGAGYVFLKDAVKDDAE